jgi:hypothetical protein
MRDKLGLCSFGHDGGDVIGGVPADCRFMQSVARR